MSQDKQKLIDAFNKAHEAGNTDDAQFFADKIKSLETKQKLPEEITEEKPKITAAQYLLDLRQAIPSGLASGVAALGAFPGMVERATTYLPGGQRTGGFDYASALNSPETFGKSESGRYLFPNYQQTLASINKFIPGSEKITSFQPKTTPGKYAKTISEFAGPQAGVGVGIKAFNALKNPAARTLGTTPVAKQLVPGVAAGATFESLDQAGVSPLLNLGITLPVAIGVTALFSPSKAAKLSSEALKGTTAEELALAVNLEKEAVKLGIPISAVEVINSKVVNKLGEIVYGTTEGGSTMYNYLKTRPDALDRQTKILLDSIITEPKSKRAVFEKIGVTANDAIESAAKIRADTAYNAGYKLSNLESIASDKMFNILDKIDGAIQALPQGSPNIKILNNLKKRLSIKPDALERQAGLEILPQTNINKIDSAFKEFAGNIKTSKLGTASGPRFIDTEGAQLLFNRNKTGILDEVKTVLNTNANYANANKTFEALSESLVNFTIKNVKPLLKTESVTPAKIKNFIFNADTANRLDIKNTYKILNKENKTAFPELARVYIENAANKAFIPTDKGRSLSEGFNLVTELTGSKFAKTNFNEVLRGVAEANGVKPNNLIVGFDKFSKILEKTARLGNVNTPGLQVEYQKGMVKQVAQIRSFMWQLKLATRYGEFVEQKTIKHLSNVLTQPDSVKQLVALAQTDIKTFTAMNRVKNIILLSQPQIKNGTTNEQGFPINEEGQELPALQ